MPTYEYECPSEHRSEEERPFETRSDPKSCPVCGEPAVPVPSLFSHQWEEWSARDIEVRNGAKEVHRGVMADGTPFETIGGPPPKTLAEQHGGGPYRTG